jgi:guanylate kinase
LGKNKLIVITAPSGSGKTTLVKRLLESCPDVEFSISACTRLPRNGEINGRDYYFYNEEVFKRLIEEDAFAEWEMVYTGKYYGTPKAELQRIWDNGRIPLVDIDVQGALALRASYPGNCLTIFIETPSLEVLRERLLARGTETPKSLEERISKAAYELTFAPQFDRIVINDNLDSAIKDMNRVVEEFAGN